MQPSIIHKQKQLQDLKQVILSEPENTAALSRYNELCKELGIDIEAATIADDEQPEKPKKTTKKD